MSKKILTYNDFDGKTVGEVIDMLRINFDAEDKIDYMIDTHHNPFHGTEYNDEYLCITTDR